LHDTVTILVFLTYLRKFGENPFPLQAQLFWKMRAITENYVSHTILIESTNLRNYFCFQSSLVEGGNCSFGMNYASTQIPLTVSIGTPVAPTIRICHVSANE
jgi:hypothetical protein